jgi:hypothetical protein
MNAVSLRDARTLIDVAGAIEYDSGPGAFVPDGLTPLLGLLGADWLTYCEGPIGSAHHQVKCEVETRPFAGHSEELEAIFVAHFHEFTLGCRPAPKSGVVLIGDVMTDRAWRRTSVYNAHRGCRAARRNRPTPPHAEREATSGPVLRNAGLALTPLKRMGAAI